MASENQPPPGEMARETQPSAAEMVGEKQPPAAKRARGNQPPPAEEEGETQQPPADMEGEMQPPPLPACVSKVLDDDNLLTEIIVRLGFPTSLVRAAAVSRRWLQLTSHRAFLRRFRELHPPRLLGFYIAKREYPHHAECFFQTLPQPSPPELATVVRRTSFRLETYNSRYNDIMGCWNGRVVTRVPLDLLSKIAIVVHNPLRSERGMTIISKLHLESQEGCFFLYGQLLSKEEGDTVSYYYVRLAYTRDSKSLVQVYMLRNGDAAWCTHLTMTIDCHITPRTKPKAVLLDNKIYMAGVRNEIAVLDLMASSFSTIQLPQGVDFSTMGTTMLSRADDASALYLIHAKELQIHIWLHKGGNWLLMDSICLREMCAPFLEDDPTVLLKINHVGDYTAEFLFLEMGRFALYLDVKCGTLRKVYEMPKEDPYFSSIYPFMMIWPPTFPVLKDAPASNAT